MEKLLTENILKVLNIIITVKKNLMENIKMEEYLKEKAMMIMVL